MIDLARTAAEADAPSPQTPAPPQTPPSQTPPSQTPPSQTPPSQTPPITGEATDPALNGRARSRSLSPQAGAPALRHGPSRRRPGVRPGRHSRDPSPGPAGHPYNTPPLPARHRVFRQHPLATSAGRHCSATSTAPGRAAAAPRFTATCITSGIKEDGGETSVGNCSFFLPVPS